MSNKQTNRLFVIMPRWPGWHSTVKHKFGWPRLDYIEAGVFITGQLLNAACIQTLILTYPCHDTMTALWISARMLSGVMVPIKYFSDDYSTAVVPHRLYLFIILLLERANLAVSFLFSFLQRWSAIFCRGQGHQWLLSVNVVFDQIHYII